MRDRANSVCPCGFFLRSSCCSLGSPAFGAEANYSEEMLLHFKLVFCRHCILDGLELRREKLDDLPALRTDHVIVVLVFVVMLVVSSTIAKADFPSKASFRQ